MKKICLILLAALVLVCPVFASENTHQTTLTYEVGEAYTWTAPAAITFVTNSNNDVEAGTVSVTSNVIAAGKKLQIKIDSGEDFLMTLTGGSDTRSYKVLIGETEKEAGDVVLEVLAGTNTGSQALNFALQSVSVQKAGTYSGTCNFVAAVVDAN
jgi:hypothetical protein